MTTSTRSTRSATKTPTKKRAGAKPTPKDGDSPYFSKRKASKDDEESDALDDEEEEGVEPEKRRGAVKKKKIPRKNLKRKLSDEEDDNDSDALDDDFEQDEEEVVVTRKRGKRGQATKNSSPQKKRKKAVADDEEFDVDADLDEGQELVGVVVQAPKTGHVPPGQISQNTFDFLTKLKDPACNDREWFRLHEPVYRLAEKEWKAFIEAFTDVLVEVDEQVPPLPPKDVIHRIYRDVRFSNDKTPYKKGLSASFSRSGRKGIFAGCAHIFVTLVAQRLLTPITQIIFKPGNESIIAAGSWCPARNELATIRSNIQRNPRRLRRVLADPDFVRLFGKPKPHPKGERQSIFGAEDELKVAPKGVAKDDENIDLLKCRSFAVSHKFKDSEVLSPEFKEIIGVVARIMQPLVHCLNDMMTITGDEEAGSGDEDEESEANNDEEDED